MKMTSELKSETARRNGAKSKGPITPEGRQASAGSNLKHGLLSESVVLEGESIERFDALHDEIFALVEPEGPIETSFAENMVMCRWRQMRLWVLESAAVNHEMRKQAPAHQNEDDPTRAALAHRALIDETRSLEVLNRYETRFDRQFNRAIQQLHELQTRRKKSDFADEPKPEEF